MKLRQLTLQQALHGLGEKDFSLGELYADFRAAITDAAQFNIYLSQNELAESQAQEREDLPLAGLPLAIKDNILVPGMPATAASKVLEDYQPQYEATVMQRLHDAGAVTLGKTNLDAWAHGSSTETSDFGRSLNPRNPDYLPGGSSGGSAAAVAADTCLAALGTETAGSVRGPASACGIVGLKPSYGRVSRRGIVAMASSTDQPGPMSKTVADAALLLEFMAGRDPIDASSRPESVPEYHRHLGDSLEGMRIGFIYHDLPELAEQNAKLEAELAVFERLGAKVEKADALDYKLAISVYTILQRAEVSSNLARYDGIRYGQDRSEFGAEARRRIMLGTFVLSKGYADKYYVKAEEVRQRLMRDFARLFGSYDLLVSLTLPGYARKVGASGESALFGELEDALNEASSLAGLCGISVPCYRDPESNLFLGMNLIAPPLQEAKLLAAAYQYEQATDWNTWLKNERGEA